MITLSTSHRFPRSQPLPLPLGQRIPDDATTEHVFAPRPLPVYAARSLSRNQFLHLWSTGIPVVLTEAQNSCQGHGDPRSFIEHHGKLWVTPIDCETDQERPRMAASQFFALLLEGSPQQAILKLKVSSLAAFPTSLMQFSDVGLAAQG